MPSADTIDFDLACARCDYNVRGMPAGGACPECGQRILDSVAEQLRRRTPLRVEHARLAERAPAALRSIRAAGAYAVVANGLATLWLFVQPWMVKRYAPGRYVLLVLLCVSIACATMSIWKLAVPPHRPSRWGTAGRWLLRAGGAASLVFVVHTTFAEDFETFGGYRGLWPGWTDRHVSIALAWATALGITLRLGYAQWWLRLERQSLLAWPLMVCTLPLIGWYTLIAPFDVWYRGNFISLEYFTESPLVSNAWPLLYTEGRRELLRDGAWSFLLFAFLLLGHAVVIVADATLARLAARALRQRAAGGPSAAARTVA